MLTFVLQLVILDLCPLLAPHSDREGNSKWEVLGGKFDGLEIDEGDQFWEFSGKAEQTLTEY